MPTPLIYCPLCGMQHTPTRWKNVTLFEPKPFGKIRHSLGRAKGFETIGYVTHEDYPQTFGVMKDRMLGVLDYWISKGYVAIDEVKELIQKETSRLWVALSQARQVGDERTNGFWKSGLFG